MATSFCVLLGEPNPLLAEKSAGLVSRYDRVWCVAQVQSSCGLEKAAVALRPDLVFADLSLLQPSSVVNSLRAAAPRARVVGLVDSLSEPYVSAGQRLTVDVVVEKQHLAETLRAELRRLAILEEADDDGPTLRPGETPPLHA
jgi:DNA-binding NarL/FixJ family response regulator